MWQRALTLYYGVGAVSVALIVTVYMLGLGLGALGGGRLALTVRRKLAVYAVIELALGVFGLASLPLLGWIGAQTAGSDHIHALVYMFLFLCVPTLLMGTTLPLLVQIFSDRGGEFARSVSYLYFVNTLGAAVGALAASYGLISFAGLDAAVYGAAALNVGLAGLVAYAGTRPGGELRRAAPAEGPAEAGAEAGGLVYAGIFATGFLALGYEVAWMRIVGVLIKDSPYAFSSVLAVYLVGIGGGSYVMGRCLRRHPGMSRRDLFFSFQALLGIYVLASTAGFYHLTRLTPLGELARLSFVSEAHPRLPVLALGLSRENLHALWASVDVFFWPAVFVLVPTLVMGATFPLVAVLAQARARREGPTVGRVYACNILGNVLGGVVTGFVLLPALGTERTLLAFAACGILLLLPAAAIPGAPGGRGAKLGVIGLSAALAAAFPGRGELYDAMHVPPGPNHQRYFSEGVEGVVLTYVKGDEVRTYIGGQTHGGRPGHYFYYEATEALAYARKPRHVLVVGYGTGSFVELALRSRDVERVTLVEINGTLMRNLAEIPLFRALTSDERLETILDDGRRYLVRTDERFDTILMDPLRTATAYSGNLYSREFFELVRAHLAPGGVFLVSLDERFVLPATVARVFPHVRLYQSFALAAGEPLGVRDERRRHAILESFPPADRDLIAQRAEACRGNARYILERTAGARINRDLRPVTEYYVGYRVLDHLRHGRRLRLEDAGPPQPAGDEAC